MNKKIIQSGKPHLIFCEGRDAYYFVYFFLDYIKKKKRDFVAFEGYDFGGITQLPRALKALPFEGEFKTVLKSVSIIRDAETNAQGAFQSVQGALRGAGFAVPDALCRPAWDPAAQYPGVVTGFLFFPTCSEECTEGTLEDLCLKILAQKNAQAILADVERAIDPYLQNKTLPRPHKNRLHAYFSFTDDFVSLKIGEAAKAKAFSWENPSIASLKNFLRSILHAEEQ